MGEIILKHEGKVDSHGILAIDFSHRRVVSAFPLNIPKGYIDLLGGSSQLVGV